MNQLVPVLAVRTVNGGPYTFRVASARLETTVKRSVNFYAHDVHLLSLNKFESTFIIKESSPPQKLHFYHYDV